ncbi:MAG: hypothetical protein WD738_13170 [Pirellulales bacterium]
MASSGHDAGLVFATAFSCLAADKCWQVGVDFYATKRGPLGREAWRIPGIDVGAQNAIELTVFSKFGGEGYTAALGLLPALLCAGVLTAIRPVSGISLGLVDGQSGAGLAGRLALCWLAFPAVYFVFGALIAPFVIEAYSAEDGMLVIPPLRTILAVQAIRSTLYLLPTLAVIERWTGTRLGLWLALGWAHWALVGLSGLVIPNEFMSPELRLIHALEIGADSFAYTGILVALLAARQRE